MRGKTKHPFELKFDLEWEIGSGGDAGGGDAGGGGSGGDGDGGGGVLTTGVLSYSDVSPLSAGGDGAKVSFELSERYTTAPAQQQQEGVKRAVSDLKDAVDAALQAWPAYTV